MENKSFSRDGYIINQDYTFEYPYGKLNSDQNGCGWIAIYNLLKAMGNEVDYRLIYEDMNKILPYYGLVGTPTRIMKKVLGDYSIDFKEVKNVKAIMKSSKTFRYAIFRYFEKGVPHYITAIRLENNKFRFLNAQLGREDHICTMEEFFKEHVRIPIIKALVIY